MDRSRLPVVALLAAAVLSLSACTAAQPAPTSAPTDPSRRSPSSEPATTPQPVVTPDADAPDQIAIALIEPDTAVPTTRIIAGPAALENGMQLRISAQCRGGRIDWALWTASTELEEQRALTDGTASCDGTVSETAVGPVPYTGPVQFRLTRTDDVDEGWVQARQVAVP